MGENTCKYIMSLTSRTYKEILQFGNRQTTRLKIQKEPRHFFKADIQVANMHMNRYSTSLVIREILITNTTQVKTISIRISKV